MATLRFAKTEPGRYYAKGETHTSAATVRSVAARRRTKHEKWAVEMREAGWTCTPPADDPEPGA